MQKNARIDFANTLRGIAALAVFVSHYYGVFWSKRAVVATLTNAPALPLETHATPTYISWLQVYPIFDLGAYGVALFFIISGFVIPFSLQKMSWIGFSINRIFRIMPTYFVGFSVTLLAIMISTKHFSKEWPYNTREVLIHYIPGIRDIMWSRGIDGIIWTLEIEMKFYLLSLLIIIWFRQQSLKIFFIPIVLFMFAFYFNRMIPVWRNTNVPAWQLAMTYIMGSQYIIYMFIGVIFHYLHRKRIDAHKAYLGISGLFALFCLHWWAGPYSENLGTAWSYGFALITFAFAYSFSNFFKANRTFNFLANISYPLYVIHGVAGYVALRIMLDNGIKASVSLLVVTTFCLFFSWLIHILVEYPSQALGKRLGAKLTKTSVKNNHTC